MGFFSTLKKNMNNGGVKVELTSPGAANFDDASLPVSVVVSAKETQTINQVVVVLNAFYDVDDNNPGLGAPRTLQSLTLSGPFTITAGQSVTLAGDLPVVTMISPQITSGTGVVGGLKKWGNNINYNYTIEALVDVEGIKLDPKDSNQIIFNNTWVHGKAYNP